MKITVANHSQMANPDLFCWFCESKNQKIARGSLVSMIKAGKCCHLTTNDPDLANAVYLRAHPDKDSHDIKPFRMYCRMCNNQLGVLVRAGGKLRPSLQQFSVIFKNITNGTQVPVHTWKYDYAQKNLIVPNEHLGSSESRSIEDAKFYILDHKVWERSKASTPRIQKDLEAQEPTIFQWELDKDGSSYKVTTTKKETDEELARGINNLNLVEMVHKSWKDVKQIPKRLSKPVMIHYENPFSILSE